MHILGISAYYHDSSTCIVRDGKVIAAAQEERFSRKKHDLCFPVNAVNYCLNEAGISAKQLDAVAFYEKPYLKFERLLMQFIDTFPRSMSVFVESIPSWLSEKLLVPKNIKDLGYNGKVYYLEHHLSHAASAFLCSPYKKAAILTVDGVGEFATTTFSTGNDTEIELFKEIHFPHSLGLLYSTITAYLGFTVNNSEYKVMGLAPWGKPVYKEEFDKLIRTFDDGSFELGMDYFAYTHEKKMPSKKLEGLFGEKTREKESQITQFHKDVAASLQAKTEEVLFHLLENLYSETKLENLCMAGGVALNSAANGKILSKTPFKRIFIQPAAGDAGTSMGAALFVYNSIMKNPRQFVLNSAFLGPSFSDKEVQDYLDKNSIKYYKFGSRAEIAKKTAELVNNNFVVGWFQGRMEWGPRALGARSILSNPTNPKMQGILNLKVKHREKFRPFAPVVLFEEVNKWFECDDPLPQAADYMLMVYPVRKEKRKIIPAVTHVDGTGRLQVIRKEQHALYYQTVQEFQKLSGVPIMINTSFNIRGEPIVCTPHDAYKCMMGTGIDYLAMENCLIKRIDNPKDLWDSEKMATD
ncbi:MAG: carbamoyltransferase [Candidatus Diapherotrites archaeon]|nr:carbamoyltransferase [Candidatus Diapherotrites archaeon]